MYWPQDYKAWILQSLGFPNCDGNNPPQGGLPTPTLQIPEQENKKNPRSPLKMKNTDISVFRETKRTPPK